MSVWILHGVDWREGLQSANAAPGKDDLIERLQQLADGLDGERAVLERAIATLRKARGAA